MKHLVKSEVTDKLVKRVDRALDTINNSNCLCSIEDIVDGKKITIFKINPRIERERGDGGHRLHYYYNKAYLLLKMPSALFSYMTIVLQKYRGDRASIVFNNQGGGVFARKFKMSVNSIDGDTLNTITDTFANGLSSSATLDYYWRKVEDVDGLFHSLIAKDSIRDVIETLETVLSIKVNFKEENAIETT